MNFIPILQDTPKEVSALKSSDQFPDIAESGLPFANSQLDWAGMTEIESSVKIPKQWQSEAEVVPARMDAFVSLDARDKKGIHMSRLYLAALKAAEVSPLSFDMLESISKEFLASHEGLSLSAKIVIRCEIPMKRPALKSQKLGLRIYPIELGCIVASQKKEFWLQTEVVYSSTCPCSAALSRQIVQNRFNEKFGSLVDAEIDKKQLISSVSEWLSSEEGMAATPHGQRSIGRLRFTAESNPGPLNPKLLIDQAEDALATPVQTVVKREDEQEFARLNASNLMFAEDAARRLIAAYSRNTGFSSLNVDVTHMESLHAHNAVAHASKIF